MTERSLIVLNGAIASGKSTVARGLAGLLERQGRSSAAIDLDPLWQMLDHQTPRTGGIQHWLRAREAAAHLTDAFFGFGIEAVIIEGPFFAPDERRAYLDHVRAKVEPVFVTLRVSFEEALRRAQGDSSRGISRDPSWLAERSAESEALLPPLAATDLIVGTDGKTPAELAQRIASDLLVRRA